MHIAIGSDHAGYELKVRLLDAWSVHLPGIDETVGRQPVRYGV